MKMSMSRAVAVCLLAAAEQATASQIGSFLSQHLGFEKQQEGLVRALEFKHTLRVCNAYPDDSPLDVFRGASEKLTRDGPMSYKACQDFDNSLKAGDKLDVKVGDVASGSFSIGDLPDNDAVMLLVVHRHDAASSAVSFDSHIFGNLASPQVAVIDTYKGTAKATPRVKDVPGKNHSHRVEELRYNNVVAMSQGQYDLVLDDQDGTEVAKRSFVALERQSYVVLRTGVESKTGQSFNEDIIVFPQSDPANLPHSAAAGPRCISALLMAFFAAVALGCH